MFHTQAYRVKQEKKGRISALPIFLKNTLEIFFYCVGNGLQDDNAQSTADDEKHCVQNSKKNGMIRLPPRQILRQWTLYSFSV